MSIQFKLSDGNSKLIDTLIFNLPARMTCPGATKACSAACYAMKAQLQYKTARDARQHNFDMVKDNPNWHNEFIVQLSKKLERARKTFKYFRIHESGDFFNQQYVDSWYKICQRFPQLQFLAYTKSHMLDFSKLASLPNVTIRYSVWADSKHEPKTAMPFAIMEGIETTRPAHHCKPTDKCDSCRFCWHSPKDVMFSLH